MSSLQLVNPNKIFTLKIDQGKKLSDLIKSGDYFTCGGRDIEHIDDNFPTSDKPKEVVVKVKLTAVQAGLIEKKMYQASRYDNSELDEQDIRELAQGYSDKWTEIPLEILKKRKLEPAGVRELLWFGHYFPDIQKEVEVIALASIDRSSSFSSESGTYGHGTFAPTLSTLFRKGTIRTFGFDSIEFSSVAYFLGIFKDSKKARRK